MYAWSGKRLKVYLTEGKVVDEEVPEQLRLEFLGGRGLNAKTLFDEVKPSIDPLGPNNVFIIGCGPLGGTLASCSGRWTVTAKSPLTYAFGDGNGGGDFAAELKFAGYDQVIFYGRSPKPVYLWINDDRVELRDASQLWGKTTWDTHRLLVEELGDREIREVCIGPAGENKALFASVISSRTRSAGRGGMGAVMGSKNLKAVVVRGTGSVKVAKPDEFLRAAQESLQSIMATKFQQTFREQGSFYLTRANIALRAVATRNTQTGYFEEWEKMTSEAFEAQYALKQGGCFACPVHCSHYYRVKEGPYTTYGEAVEFATINAFCSKIGNDNLAAALLASTICDQLGLDTISCGGTIAFAMEAWQRGLISAKDTDGLDLSWGNMEAVIVLLRKIAYREGFGNLLADGSRLASKRIKGSEAFAMQVKGLEIGSIFPSAKQDKAKLFATATATRGADHLRGWTHLLGHPKIVELLGKEGAARIIDPVSYSGKGVFIATDQDFRAASDSLEICYWVNGERMGLDLHDMARLFSTASGVEMSGDDLLKVGQRVNNVEKSFNVREGFGRRDDTLPQRFFAEQEGEGLHSGVDPDRFQALLDEYYEFRGWDKQGIPTRKKLEELNLDYIAPQILAH